MKSVKVTALCIVLSICIITALGASTFKMDDDHDHAGIAKREATVKMDDDHDHANIAKREATVKMDDDHDHANIAKREAATHPPQTRSIHDDMHRPINEEVASLGSIGETRHKRRCRTTTTAATTTTTAAG